jgi:hypothetical protein
MGLDSKLAYEPEVVISMSAGFRQEGLPIQALMERFLGVRLPLQAQVDNDQCIIAVKRGFSKKLRQLARTHRVSLAVVHELVAEPSQNIEVVYCPTAEQLVDAFTKTLNPALFVAARSAMGLLPIKH